MTKTNADEKKDVRILSDEMRSDILIQLENMGINGSDLPDIELITKLNKTLAETHNRLIQEKAGVADELNQYAATPNIFINDKEFITRLFNLNVHRRYLKIFRNEDKTLTDSQIWEKVRFSGIRPFIDTADVFMDRSRKEIY